MIVLLFLFLFYFFLMLIILSSESSVNVELFYRLDNLEELDVNTNNLEVCKDFIMRICAMQ